MLTGTKTESKWMNQRFTYSKESWDNYFNSRISLLAFKIIIQFLKSWTYHVIHQSFLLWSLFFNLQVLDWFWTIVASFTEEHMARLLQFTTGCSQLPPGGFSELNPKFQITAAPTYNTLPTAHTWYVLMSTHCLLTVDSFRIYCDTYFIVQTDAIWIPKFNLKALIFLWPTFWYKHL